MTAATEMEPVSDVLQSAGFGALGGAPAPEAAEAGEADTVSAKWREREKGKAVEAEPSEDGKPKLTRDAPSPEAVEAALRELARRLEGADAIRRATAREAAVQALKKAGAGSPGALVDAALGGTPKGASEGEQQGSAMALSEPEKWPHPVDGAELLDELVRTFEKYVSLPDAAAVALALWCLHAHAHDAAAVSPLLALTSPEKRCGKSTTLTLVGALVPKPLSASNIPPAALFRAVQAFQPTLLVDEADTFLVGKNADDSLRGILNSGHLRSGATVVRCVGENFEPRLFSTWAPKAIALIGRLPGTLEDRSVPVALQRQPPGEKKCRLRLDKLDELEHLRQKAARWTADHMDALGRADPAVPEQLHDRAQDNWRTLLAIADKAGGKWPERARAAALALSGGAAADDSAGPMLLADLRALFDAKKVYRLRSAEVVAALVEREDRPWPEWKQGKPLTVRQLARLLKPFGIGPHQGKLDGDKIRGYDRADCEDAFKRYLPAHTPPGEAVLPVPSSNGAAFPGNEKRYPTTAGTGCENGETPTGAYKVPAVPDEKGEAAPELALVPDEPAAEWWEP